ncbi:MAG: GGDEF domain-containing protein [Parvibaculum sp.]|uniref:GGDEF domain-containing protein n=1 Tax=Parvibaculum sp. TaxID=2024848 RepID=UPI0025E04F55|nr:GGDEF domain-containing protein [Parvibaculum sp.]MCE9648770.1 GGDEF domain-containing protein [Parvibaculum sp.]
MKIGDSRPLGAVQVPPRERGEMAGGTGAGRTISDAVSFMGIPEAEITPHVRDALMSLMAEVDQLRRDVEKMRQRLREAEQLADHDPLLPVLNRRAFMAELSRVIAYGRRYKEPAALAYFDIDNFKQVNDTYGHAAGDVALKHLTEVVGANLRETDIVGRLGGDEFGVILARTDEASAHAKAKSLALLISLHPLMINGAEIPLSISVGAIAIGGDADAVEALAQADQAMYRAKRQPQ